MSQARTTEAAQVRGREIQLEAVLDIARAVGSTLDLKQVLKLIAGRTAEAVGAARCSISLLKGGHLVPAMSQFADGHADPVQWEKFKALGPQEVPAYAEAIRTRGPVLIEDATASRFVPASWIDSFGISAALIVPLLRHDQAIGILNIDRSDGPYRWREDQVGLAMAIASQAGLAVENARLYAQLGEQVKELKQTQAQLLQAAKLAAVGQLVAGVAHEINNPLAVVLGHAQLLERECDDPRTRERAEKIAASVERAARIVRQLTTFASARPEKLAAVELRDVVLRVLALRQHTLSVGGISVDCDLPLGLPPVHGDGSQLEQAVLSLLLNAEWAARSADGPAAISIRLTAAGDRVRLTVADTGPGIARDVLPRIFEPFFTTKPVGEGTGLGLSICYSLVEAHGGRLWADSEPGRGATFVMELPAEGTLPAVIYGEDEAEAAPDDLGTSAPSLDRAILVVDDESDVAEMLQEILQSLGFHAHVALGGEAGWRALSAPDAGYDLVTLDLKMPDLSGEKLYRRLRESASAFADRVVFVTGDSVDPRTRRFLAEMGRPVIQKPFEVSQLAEVVSGELRLLK